MKAKSNFWLPLLVAGLVLVSAAAAYSQLLPAQAQPGGPDYVAGEVLIQFKPDVNDAQIANAFRSGEDHGQIGLTHATTTPSGPQAPLQNARVWVQFNTGKHAAVKALIKQAGGEVHHDFVNINAIAASLPTQALAGLQQNPDVFLVEEDPIREMSGQTTPYGIDMVQAPSVWASPVPDIGGGIKVGVIDSGVWTGHEDLAGVPFTGDGLAGQNSPGWDSDGCGHGTHVVGTIVAANNDLGVVGVAPGVSIHMVRAFGDDCGWTYSSTLVNAAYLCQSAGAKIISMSLGHGAPSATEEAAFQDLYNQGVLCIAAAGNGGNTNYDYPASYSSVISVAAIDTTKTIADFSQQNNAVELAAPGVNVLSTWPVVTPAELTVDGQGYSAQTIEYTGNSPISGQLVDGGYGDHVDPSWAGKVVLVKRGSSTGGFMLFEDKLKNIQNGGGIAAIIYNNVSGQFGGSLAPNASSIPAVSISLEDGTDLLASKLNTIAVVTTYAAGPGSGYANASGTSMATPHVSGVAALVWSSRPGATASQVRAALRGSALDLGALGYDNAYGYGLVQASQAINYLNDPTKDTIPPKIISGPTGTVGKKPGTFTISWTTDELSDSIVTFVSPSLSNYSNAALTKSHSMSFTGQKNVTYIYWVSSSDAAGNMVTKKATIKP